MSTFLCLFMAVLLALVSSKPTTETDIVAEILKAIDGRDEMWRVTSYLKESRDDLVKELPLVSPDGTKLSYTFFAPTSFAFTMQTPQDTVDPLFVDASLRNKVLIRHFARQSISPDDLAKLDKLVMADSQEVVLSGKSGIEICDLPPIGNKGHECYAIQPKWTFRSGKCVSYVYGGCLGTENLFDTEEDCLAKCGPAVNTRAKTIKDAQIQPEAIQLSQDFGVVYLVDRVFMDGDEVHNAISEHFKRNPNTALCLGLPCTPENAPIATVDDDATVDDPALDIRNTPLAPPPQLLLLGGYSAASASEEDVQEIAKFATNALSQNANQASPFVLVQVVKAEKQVVSGLNYRLQIELKENADSANVISCSVVVYDQSWTSTRQITSSECNPPIVAAPPRIEIIPIPLAERS